MHLGNIGPSRSAGDGREALPRVRPDTCRRSFFVPLRMGSWVIGAEALCDLATPDRAGGASLLWGLSSVDCGRSDYFIFLCDGVAIFAVMRKVLILALAMQASGPTRISRRTLPCKALVTPTAQRVAEWKKKTE